MKLLKRKWKRFVVRAVLFMERHSDPLPDEVPWIKQPSH